MIKNLVVGLISPMRITLNNEKLKEYDIKQGKRNQPGTRQTVQKSTEGGSQTNE
jgi:hypothetical protein